MHFSCRESLFLLVALCPYFHQKTYAVLSNHYYRVEFRWFVALFWWKGNERWRGLFWSLGLSLHRKLIFWWASRVGLGCFCSVLCATFEFFVIIIVISNLSDIDNWNDSLMNMEDHLARRVLVVLEPKFAADLYRFKFLPGLFWFFGVSFLFLFWLWLLFLLLTCFAVVFFIFPLGLLPLLYRGSSSSLLFNFPIPLASWLHYLLSAVA